MDEGKIEITWYGTASVRISSGNSQLLIDPFFPFRDSRVKVAADAYDGCRHILVSHGHFDHISSISRIVRRDTIIFCTKTPYRSLCRNGVGRKNLHMIQVGSVFDIGDFRITAYKGKHIKLSAWNIVRTLFGRRIMQNRKGIVRKLMKIMPFPERNESLCYLIEVYGKRILILGSLATAEDIDYPKGVDIAFFPYQGICDLCGIASEIYDKLRPKAVLLTHFDDTFPPFSSDIDTSAFEACLKERAVVYKLRHGGSVKI